jgi:hypothetical protein
VLQVNRKWNLVVRGRRVFVARLLNGRGGDAQAAAAAAVTQGATSAGTGRTTVAPPLPFSETEAGLVQEALAWSYGSGKGA